MSPPAQLRTVSAIVPVYDEALTVEATLAALRDAALPEGLVLDEILVVDDGSRDGSGALLEQLAAAWDGVPTLRLLRHESNRGKGAALRTALDHTTGDVVVFQDADLEYDPRDLRALLAPLAEGDADAVIGSRFLGGGARRVLLFWHSLGNQLITLWSNLFTNLNLSDVESGYKAARGDILRSIPIRCDRFGVEPELVAKLAKRGCRIYEVPISYRGRTYAEGKKVSWWDGLVALVIVVWYWLIDDMYSGRYGEDILHSLSHTPNFNRWMADRLKPWVGDDVLEIGAGLGSLTWQLLPRRRRYLASDIDPVYLDYLRKRYAGLTRIEVARIDLAEPDDFAPWEGQFDTVVALNVVEHIEDDAAALAHIRRALKPGGRACILVPRGRWLYGSLDRVLEHYRRYTPAELADKLRAAGFELETQFGFNAITVPAWFVNGRILRRTRFGRFQLKVFDSTVWLWRRLDRWIPWPGISLIAIGRVPLETPTEAPTEAEAPAEISAEAPAEPARDGQTAPSRLAEPAEPAR